jgi:hypothetical protein
MPDRRTFLITCSGVVAVPALAQFALSLAERALPVSPAAEAPTLALRIDGWDSRTDSSNDVWVQINSSWRATWR